MNRFSASLLCALCFVASGCEVPSVVGGGRAPVELVRCDDPEALAAWRAARTALQRGDDRAALPLLKSAVARCPDLVRAHCAYQDAAGRLGGPAASEMAAFYADFSGGSAPLPSYLLARLAETAYAQANELSRILSKYPSFAWAHLSMARISRGQGRLSESLRRFGDAFRKDSSMAEAQRERAQVLVELGRNQEAAVDYQAYLAARPGDVDAARELVALLLYGLDRVDQAMHWISMLEAGGDRSISLRMDRAAALWRSDRLRAAVEGYLEILAEAPDNARAALNVGLLYYEVVPQSEGMRASCWPRARAAFQMFMEHSEATDGHEQFERTWAVPYRLRRIDDALGQPSAGAPKLVDLRWPDGI